MTYVYVDWPDERPEHVTHATVSKSDDLKTLAKQCAGQRREVEYTDDELLANARVYGARRHRELGQTE
jgi:hypothetical protein